MQDMWIKRLEEKGFKVYRDELGFFSYRVDPCNVFFVSELFVQPQHRGIEAITHLYMKACKLAVINKCTLFKGIVRANGKDPFKLIKLYRGFGLEIVDTCEDAGIVMVGEVPNVV